MRKRAGYLYLGIVALVMVLNVIAWCSTAFSDAYIKYLFPVWVNTYGRFMGLFPFSVGEILLVSGVLCICIFVMLVMICFLLGVYGLLKGKGYTSGRFRNGLWKFSKGYFCFFAWVVLVVIRNWVNNISYLQKYIWMKQVLICI